MAFVRRAVFAGSLSAEPSRALETSPSAGRSGSSERMVRQAGVRVGPSFRLGFWVSFCLGLSNVYTNMYIHVYIRVYIYIYIMTGEGVWFAST